MKIAHIGPSNLPVLFNRGGAIERRIVEIASVQAKSGNEVVVYSAEAATGDAWHNGFRLRALKCNWAGLPQRLEFLAKVARDLRRHPVDVVHCHSVPESIWFLRNSLSLKFLSYDFFRSRSWSHFSTYRLYRWTFRQYDWLLPVSEFCLKESEQFWKLTRNKMRVLHNGVNLEQFRPDSAAGKALRDRLELGDDPVVLYVGRVCEQKGSDILIDAYERLKKSMPQVRLVVAGPAEQFGNLGSSPLVARIKAVGGVYLGAIDESDLSAVYNLATVFVMPTRRDEMFGMAAVEAQACGKPVICSRQGGLPEVIPETSGIHFPVGDSGTLASALERVLSDETLYQSLARAARENALRFSWNAIVDELGELCCAGSHQHK
jgi:glycosyltransferase involved in cell wall biosynthesis